MIHETENLALDEDGDVWLRFLDEDGESDIKRIGDVDSCHLEVDHDDDLYEEALDIQAAWRDAVSERIGYESGMGAYWGG